LRGYGLRMMQNFVTDFAFVQTIDELQWYFHNWLRCKLSLSRAISTSCVQRVGNQNHKFSSCEVRVPAGGKKKCEFPVAKIKRTPPQRRRRAKELCMATCEVCENEYDKAFEVVVAGKRHTFDSFECAIHALAPVCPHCHCRVVGHGVEANGQIFCCVHCARTAGKTQLKDRV
jgi:hypothetical protein